MINILVRGGIAAAALGFLASAAWAVPIDIQSKIEAYLKSTYPADGPGAAVVVVDDGKIVYSGGQGLADVNTRRKITPNTVFRMGSLTKQFVAPVILQLEQEGKLSLNDPVSKYLPDYPKPGADATIAQLLNHTSGIKSFTSLPNWMMGGGRAKPITTEKLIDVFKNEPVDFQPGTRHLYNNSGYVLLGAIIEKITARPWHEAVDERIVRPLGLRTIRQGVQEGSMPDMATGYSEEDGKIVPAMPLHMSSPHAAGSLIGSPIDFAKWNEALHKGKVLAKPEYAQMIAPTKLPDGKLAPYGFGMGLGKLQGFNTLLHSGDTAGFDTSTIYVPSEDLFVAVFTNSDQPAVSPMVARMKIAAMALGKPFQEFRRVEVPASELEPLLGVYKFQGGERRFFAKDGKLYTRRTGANDEEVLAAGGDRFFYGPTTITWFEIRRDPAGKPVMTSYLGAEQRVEMANWTGPIPVETAANVPRAVLASYVGTYKTVRGITTVALGEDGALTMRLGSGRQLGLSARNESEFSIEGMDAKLVFHSVAGTVTHFTFQQGERKLQGDKQPG